MRTYCTPITGTEAIELAEAHPTARLNKLADPVTQAQEGIDPSWAREIVREDPTLVWLDPSQMTSTEFLALVFDVADEHDTCMDKRLAFQALNMHHLPRMVRQWADQATLV